MWCEHLYWRKDFGGEWIMNEMGLPKCNHYKFCPICGTPKPKEKSLEEKFEDYLIRPRTRDTRVTAEDLVDMARQHFGMEEFNLTN